MDINVSYYCACSPGQNKPQSKSLESLINSEKPLNLCPIHSMTTLKFYCNFCKKFFCEKCQRDNEEHNKDFINIDIIMSEDIAEKIKNNSHKTQNKDKYIKLINDYLNNIKKIKIPKYQLKKTGNLHDKVTAIVLLKSGLVATGSYDKTIRIWKIKELFCVRKIKVLGKVLALLEFKPNMLLSSNENIICLWDLNSDKDECIHIFKEHELWVNCLVKYDNKIFASASNDHKIIIWDYEQRKRIKKFEVHKDCILALIKLNDGNLCSGGADFAIKIFDWKQEKLINKLKGHQNMVKCLCQMDNETLLSGSDDRTIKVWKNYKCIFTIEGHSHLVKALLKLNDNYFVSGSFDNTIKIWDIKTFLSRQTLTDHSSNILCLLKLNNNDLVSCSEDNTIKIWGKDYLINYNKLPIGKNSKKRVKK
jgi:WD40 repeat protein